MAHYDVGILGVWFGCNYGSIATYYALAKTIEAFGLSVLMVHRPRLEADDGRMKGRHSVRFAEEHYAISKSYHVSEISELNELCDIFVLGSDQIWNYGVTKIFGHSYFLDFAGEHKRKIAYATSFGGNKFTAPYPYAKKARKALARMDAISVREADGVRICETVFGVKATHVLDPVLMCDAAVLGNLAKKSKGQETEPYIATYILDPTPEKREALQYVSRHFGKKMIHMLDGWRNKFAENKKKLKLENTVENLQVEDWISYIKNSDFVITDSFHGTCMAIVFQKPFIAIGNPSRGSSRFESVLESLGLTGRYVSCASEVLKRKELLEAIDYQAVKQKLEAQRAFSKNWLEEALFGAKQNPQLGLWKRIKSDLGFSLSCIRYDIQVQIKKIIQKTR